MKSRVFTLGALLAILLGSGLQAQKVAAKGCSENRRGVYADDQREPADMHFSKILPLAEKGILGQQMAMLTADAKEENQLPNHPITQSALEWV